MLCRIMWEHHPDAGSIPAISTRTKIRPGFAGAIFVVWTENSDSHHFSYPVKPQGITTR
ncbi:MAG: hypothetical protein BMS9Abin13_136 [Patescibacteria group bacterium]|nr:MAG: hypothetical protein BMS9Abin13_136 [Patescibacteria group bacterium]